MKGPTVVVICVRQRFGIQVDLAENKPRKMIAGYSCLDIHVLAW